MAFFKQTTYHLIFYVPLDHSEKVKGAIFSAGGGELGKYSHCCWQTTGKGQFKPLAGSSPFIGSENKITIVEEVKVELIVQKKYLKKVLQALISSHPYETPAYTVTKCKKI